MLKKIHALRFPVLCVVTLATAIFLEFRFNLSDLKQINIRHFEKVLHQKEEKTKRLVYELDRFLKETGNIYRAYARYDFDFSNLHRQGIDFLIYDNDSLTYWSDNSLPLRNIYPTSIFNTHVVKLPNGWYVAEKKTGSRFKIVGLIKIKNEYPYQNDYLYNEFQKDFKIPYYKNISVSLTAEGLPVYSNNNEFLFNLVIPENPLKNQIPLSFSVILYLLFFLFLILYLNQILIHFKNQFYRNAAVLILGGLLFLLRFAILQVQIPEIFRHAGLFNPFYYAGSSWTPSMGDLLLHALFLLAFAYLFYFNFSFKFFVKNNKIIGELSFLLSAGMLTTLFVLISNTLGSLITDSTLSFKLFEILNLSKYSLLGFIIMAVLIFSFLLFADKIIYETKTDSDYQKYIYKVSAYIIIYSLILWLAGMSVEFHNPVFLLIFLLFLGYFRYIRTGYSFSSYLLLALLASVYTVTFTEIKMNEKTSKEAQVLVVNLANERDQIAEYMFEEISRKMKNDAYIQNYLSEPVMDISLLEDHINRTYFSGYFRKYYAQVTVCQPDEDLLLENTNELVHCHDFFDSLIKKGGFQIPGTSFYFLENPGGRISYLGIIAFGYEKHQVNLFVSLDSKLVIDQLGYPELLLEGKREKPAHMYRYSYAKYHHDNLISQSGDYLYNLVCPPAFINTRHEISRIRMNRYIHYVYKAGDYYTVILSYPGIKVVNVVVQFTYVLLFYLIIALFLLFIIEYPGVLENLRYDFKNRIRLAVITILLLSFLFTGAATILLSIKRFENKQYEFLNEKMQSIMVELERRVGYESYIDQSWRTYLTNHLRRLSNVFYTDIHLYGYQGELIASSRPEIFERGLTGTRMHPEAFRQLIMNHAPRFIHKEKIGHLSYLSAYLPLKNINNRLLAYVNLPYFTKQNILREEINTLVIAIVNVYILLIVITLFMTIFMTSMITRPLKLIQEKIKEIDIGKPIEPINYQSHDEIGSLIKEYNRMVRELKENIEKLARTEREMAWREMAKQIAHEINNPLTPMKLSVQHLLRSWKDKTPKWDEYFEKTSQTLIEQIDNLSHIASEFSNFATMPKIQNEPVNLIESITTIIKLFDNYENIRFETSLAESCVIWADKEHISRVFTNLIKNAIQAIPADKEGKIEISLEKKHDRAEIKITDNGEGIPDKLKEKLFQPNFTTKSSGMGMGLAITRSIVNQADGKIWFESTQGYGTTFFIQLPLLKDEATA